MNSRLHALMALAAGVQVDVPPYVPSAPVVTHPVTEVQQIPPILIVHDNADLRFQVSDSKRLQRWIIAAGIPLRSVQEWYQMPPESVLHDPAVKVIVPTGNVGLAHLFQSLSGLESYHLHSQVSTSVAQRRGSVYAWHDKWIIPALSSLVVKGSLKHWERRSHLDWARIRSFAQSPTQLLPKPMCVISPTEGDLQWLHSDMARTGYLSLDIETLPSEGKMLCIGFSASPERALCLEWNASNLPIIQELCASDTTKVVWNGLYDFFWLHFESISVRGKVIDGMTLLHTLMPTDNVSLAYAASTETLHPFWKDTAKEQDDRTALQNWNNFKRYNCLDALVALEVTLALIDKVKAAGLWSFYENHYAALYGPMLDVMLRGVAIAHEARHTLLAQYQAQARRHRDALAAYNGGEPLFTLTTQTEKRVWAQLTAGEDPYTSVHEAKPREREAVERAIATIQAKTVSGVKLKHLLYTTCAVPAQLRRRGGAGEETESSDIFALRQIANDYRHDPTVSAIVEHALEHTRLSKLATFLYDSRYDEDGRMRFSLKFLTEIGRLASSASPRGRRVNSQNIPREQAVRSLIIPEPEHVCLQVDMSAAEARVCLILSRDPELITLARKSPVEYDQHRHTGVIVGLTGNFDETDENMALVSKDQRQVAKVINHAAQRAAQAFTIAQTLLRNNITNEKGELFSEEECEAALVRYHRRFPAIRYWHARVRSAVRRHRMLVNTWGRRWPVPYDYFSDELWRRAYSVSLASEVADILNQWGFRAVHEFIHREGLKSRVMLQEHDGLVLSCPLTEVYDVATFLRNSLERERDYWGISLAIPVEFQVGEAWGQGTSWKSLPTREEMEAAATA